MTIQREEMWEYMHRRGNEVPFHGKGQLLSLGMGDVKLIKAGYTQEKNRTWGEKDAKCTRRKENK